MSDHLNKTPSRTAIKLCARCTLEMRRRLLGCEEQVAVRIHCSSLKRNGHKQLAPRHPSHLQSATDHSETAILNRLLLTQVLPVESKGQRKNGLSKIRFWTTDSPQDAFSAPLARSEISLIVELRFSKQPQNHELQKFLGKIRRGQSFFLLMTLPRDFTFPSETSNQT